jgi:hypothetical protein
MDIGWIEHIWRALEKRYHLAPKDVHGVQRVKYKRDRVPSMSLHRVILLERRLRLTRVLYGN